MRTTSTPGLRTPRADWAARSVLIAGIYLALIAMCSGCDESQSASSRPPPKVEVATPAQRSVTEYFYYTGTLEPVEFVQLRARVGGVLEKIHFEESSDVEQGDVLFTIEKEPYELAVGQARAALERARAARQLADVRVQRLEQALQGQAANELEVFEQRARLQQAEADVFAAEEALKAAELDLSYTDVRSPISGRIDRHYIDQGNLVGAQLASGGVATLLASVVTLDPVHVRFDVSEAIALRYLDAGRDGSRERAYPPVQLSLADEQGYPHAGRVDFVDNQLDDSTGTLQVRAVLDNPTGKLYPGLFARIRVPWQQRENALCVHQEAVATGLEGKYLLIVGEDDVVERRPVTLGERQDDGTIVVLEGISADETYIVRGVQKARPGAPVSPQPFQEQDASASGEAAATGPQEASGQGS